MLTLESYEVCLPNPLNTKYKVTAICSLGRYGNLVSELGYTLIKAEYGGFNIKFTFWLNREELTIDYITSLVEKESVKIDTQLEKLTEFAKMLEISKVIDLKEILL